MAYRNEPPWRYGTEPLTRRDRLAALWKFPLIWLGWCALVGALGGISYGLHSAGLSWPTSGISAVAAVTIAAGLIERYFFAD